MRNQITVIYTTIINPDFATEYLDKTLVTMKETMSPDVFETEKEKLKEQMEAYGGSGFMAFIMFITVVMIGFVISLTILLSIKESLLPNSTLFPCMYNWRFLIKLQCYCYQKRNQILSHS